MKFFWCQEGIFVGEEKAVAYHVPDRTPFWGWGSGCEMLLCYFVTVLLCYVGDVGTSL